MFFRFVWSRLHFHAFSESGCELPFMVCVAASVCVLNTFREAFNYLLALIIEFLACFCGTCSKRIRKKQSNWKAVKFENLFVCWFYSVVPPKTICTCVVQDTRAMNFIFYFIYLFFLNLFTTLTTLLTYLLTYILT